MKYLRKILLSASLFGAVCAYADISDFNHFRLGLGGMYGLYQINNQDDVTKNAAGYIILHLSEEIPISIIAFLLKQGVRFLELV